MSRNLSWLLSGVDQRGGEFLRGEQPAQTSCILALTAERRQNRGDPGEPQPPSSTASFASDCRLRGAAGRAGSVCPQGRVCVSPEQGLCVQGRVCVSRAGSVCPEHGECVRGGSWLWAALNLAAPGAELRAQGCSPLCGRLTPGTRSPPSPSSIRSGKRGGAEEPRGSGDRGCPLRRAPGRAPAPRPWRRQREVPSRARSERGDTVPGLSAGTRRQVCPGPSLALPCPPAPIQQVVRGWEGSQAHPALPGSKMIRLLPLGQAQLF